MWANLLTIQEVNSLESGHFIKIFGNIVEHCPAAAIGILKNRPFQDVETVVSAVFQYLDNLRINEKETILQVYSDTVNKLADLSATTFDFGTHERITGTRNLRFDEKKRLRQLSKQYKDKFGFPFVICAKEKDIDNIILVMMGRMTNEKNQEIEIAITEAKSISKLRLYEIVMQ